MSLVTSTFDVVCCVRRHGDLNVVMDCYFFSCIPGCELSDCFTVVVRNEIHEGCNFGPLARFRDARVTATINSKTLNAVASSMDLSYVSEPSEGSFTARTIPADRCEVSMT